MAPKVSSLPAGEGLSPQLTAYLQKIEKLASRAISLAAVDPIGAGSTTYTPTSGVSKTMTVLAGTPVIETFLVYGTASATTQQILNNFATIADALTKAETNHTDLQTAVSALDARLTALENKINEIITAGTPS